MYGRSDLPVDSSVFFVGQFCFAYFNHSGEQLFFLCVGVFLLYDYLAGR